MRTLQPLQQKTSGHPTAAAPKLAQSSRAFAPAVPAQFASQSSAESRTQPASATQPAFSLANIPVSLSTSPATTAAQAGAPRRRLFGQAGMRPVLQRKIAPATPFKGNLRKADIQAARGRGDHLEEHAQGILERKLNVDLSPVHVHTDARADRLTRSAHALAFTTGADIFFRRGTYRPDSQQGLRLLAHEVSHVVQQATGTVTGVPYAEGVSVSDPDDRFEQAAQADAARVLAGGDGGTGARESRAALPAAMSNGAQMVLQRMIPGTKEEWEKHKEEIKNFKTAQEWVNWLKRVDEEGNKFEAVEEKVRVNDKESLDLPTLQSWEIAPTSLKQLCDRTRQPLSTTPSSPSISEGEGNKGQLVIPPKTKSTLKASASSFVPSPKQPPGSSSEHQQQSYIQPPNPYYQQSSMQSPNPYSQPPNPYYQQSYMPPPHMQQPNPYYQQPYMQQPYVQQPFSGSGRGLPPLHPPVSEQSRFSHTQMSALSSTSTLSKQEAPSLPSIVPKEFEPLAEPLPKIGQHSITKPHEFAFAKLLGRPPEGGDKPLARSTLLEANAVYIHRDITNSAQLGGGLKQLTFGSDFPGQIYMKGEDAHIINLVSDSRFQETLYYLSAIGIKQQKIHVSKSQMDTQKLIAEQLGPALEKIKGADIDLSAMPVSIIGQLMREHKVQEIATNTRSGPFHQIQYPYYLLSVNGNFHLVVDIKWANGEIVKDVLEVVRKYAKSIKAVNLHGICGSLNEDLKRNTLVMPQGGMVHSVLPQNKPVEIGKHVNPEPVEGVKITMHHGHVTNILQEDDETVKQLQKQTATVEMEAYPLLQKLEEMKYEGVVRIIFTISDVVTSPEQHITQREVQTEQTRTEREARNRVVIKAFKLEPK